MRFTLTGMHETHFCPCLGWTLGGSLWITMQKEPKFTQKNSRFRPSDLPPIRTFSPPKTQRSTLPLQSPDRPRFYRATYGESDLKSLAKKPSAMSFLARNYTHSENIHTAIAFLNGFTCTELGVLSTLLRELSESEAIEHACVSKSRYHTVKKTPA